MSKRQTEKKYNFVYQTKNLINGKTYIGVHCTNNINDGYIGCGIHRLSDAVRGVKRDGENRHKYSFKGAVIKYGYDNFKLEILCFFDTSEEAYEEEAWLVNEDWVKDKNNYNISLGGRLVHIMEGRNSPQYVGDIYIINKDTGEVSEPYPTATYIKRKLGLNQACISKTLSGGRTGIKNLFFTRNPDNWMNELEDIKRKFSDNRRNRVHKYIYAYEEGGVLYKRYKSKQEACRDFGKSKYGACYLDDVVDKYRKDNGKPLTAWGYYWTYNNIF